MQQNAAAARQSPDSGEIQQNNSNNTATTEAVGVCKLPPFWKQNVHLWFLQVEAQFQCHRILSDNMRYYHLLSALDPESMSEIADVVANPAETNKYEQLKTCIIKRLTMSPDRQLLRALSELDLGNRSPSQLLREMTMLAGGRASNDVLRVRWLSLLPQQVQRVLKVLGAAPIEELADLADNLMEDEAGSFVMAASHSTTAGARTHPVRISDELADCKRELAVLKSTMQKVLDNVTQKTEHKKDQQQPSNTPPKCFYHTKFGSKARRCIQPCSWTAQQGN